MIGTLIKESRNEGFTLLEVVLSLSLMTVALLAVFQLQGQNLDLQSEARFITVANHLVQKRLSKIEAGDEITIGTFAGDFGETYPGFTYQEEISEVQDMDHLFRIRVGVFLENAGVMKDQTVETYFYKREP